MKRLIQLAAILVMIMSAVEVSAIDIDHKEARHFTIHSICSGVEGQYLFQYHNFNTREHGPADGVSIEVEEGESVQYRFRYSISNNIMVEAIVVDGENVPLVGSDEFDVHYGYPWYDIYYDFYNIRSDHTIEVILAPLSTHTVTFACAGADAGFAACGQEITVPHHGALTYRNFVEINGDFYIRQILLNGEVLNYLSYETSSNLHNILLDLKLYDIQEDQVLTLVFDTIRMLPVTLQVDGNGYLFDGRGLTHCPPETGIYSQTRTYSIEAGWRWDLLFKYGEPYYDDLVSFTINGTEIDWINDQHCFEEYSEGQFFGYEYAIIVTEPLDIKLRFAQVGIERAETDDIHICAEGLNIKVEGGEGQPLLIYNIAGQPIVKGKQVSGNVYRMPSAGIYLVKLGNRKAKKNCLLSTS